MRPYLWIILLILAATSVNAVEIDLSGSAINKTGAIGNYPQLDIIGLKYEPFPVEPGDYFTLWVRVQNLGNDNADNAVVELIEKEPFFIDDSAVRVIGKLGSRQETVLKFERIRVSEDAVEGTNQIEFKLSPGGVYKSNIRIKKLDIDIQSVRPILDIEVSSEPTRIPQGGTALVTIAVRNSGASLLEDITLKLDLPEEFAPVGTTTEKKIDLLKENEQKILNFNLIALPDATAKAYKVRLNISYSDEIGNKFTKDDVMGLLVGGHVDYDVNIEDSGIFTKNTRGNVVLSISNIDASNIKFMTIELEDTDDYVVIGKRKSYLGNLESDDFETAEFEIFVKKEGDIPLRLNLEYKDSYNEEQRDRKNVLLKVYSKKEINKLGLSGEKRNILKIALIIASIIFIYLTWKFWRKEKDLGRALKLSLKEFLLALISLLSKLRWGYIKRIPRKVKLFIRLR